MVSLARTDMYFTGGTVLIDHGHGVISVYAHHAECGARRAAPAARATF